MSDKETIDVYNARVDQYVGSFGQDVPSEDLRAFMELMPAKARVLDLGCGPATASVHMRNAGLRPDPVDASQEMVRFANETHAIDARVALFSDIDQVDTYDGVWANFSLLHAPRADMPTHLAALFRALKQDGVLHLGLKTGENAERDAIGRFYTYYTEAEIRGLLKAAGFTITFSRTGREVGMAGTKDPFIILRAQRT